MIREIKESNNLGEDKVKYTNKVATNKFAHKHTHTRKEITNTDRDPLMLRPVCVFIGAKNDTQKERECVE